MVTVKETWMVMVMPETGVTVKDIAALCAHLEIKETCFGLLVESERETVREALRELLERYSTQIFLKRRCFSIEDTKICESTFILTDDPPWLPRLVGQLKRYSLS